MITAAIVQARCGSSRFPNKTFALLQGKPLIWHVIERLKSARSLDKIVLATTTNPLDDQLYSWAKENNTEVFRGNENNVLNRYYEAARHCQADIIVRITADDPFKEPKLIDEAVNKLKEEKADFVCNNNPPTYPEGLDVEVFTRDALETAESHSRDAFEREHVTQYFYHHPDSFKMYNLSHTSDLSYLRWTIDTEADFCMAREVYDVLYNETTIFHMEDILNLLKERLDIMQLNNKVVRSEMYKSK